MNPGLLIKQLRGGFRPFVLRLTDGRALPVPHLEFIAVGRRAMVVVDKAGDPVFIDPLQIVSLDQEKVGADRDRGNGRKTK